MEVSLLPLAVLAVLLVLLSSAAVALALHGLYAQPSLLAADALRASRLTLGGSPLLFAVSGDGRVTPASFGSPSPTVVNVSFPHAAPSAPHVVVSSESPSVSVAVKSVTESGFQLSARLLVEGTPAATLFHYVALL